KIVIERPSRRVAAPKRGAPEDIAPRREAVRVGMPNRGLHREALDPHLSDPGWQCAVPVGDVESVVGLAAEIERRLSFLVPVQPAAGGARGGEAQAAPALIEQAAPRISRADRVKGPAPGLPLRHHARARSRGPDLDRLEIEPDPFLELAQRAMDAKRRQ